MGYVCFFADRDKMSIIAYQTSGPKMKPARYSDAGSTRCGPVGLATWKTTGRLGEKLEGRVEE